MPKKVFDTNKMKNAVVRITNIELRISNWQFDIQDRELKVSFDIKNLIFGHFPIAKEGFDHKKTKNRGSSNIEYRITNIELVI